MALSNRFLLTLHKRQAQGDSALTPRRCPQSNENGQGSGRDDHHAEVAKIQMLSSTAAALPKNQLVQSATEASSFWRAPLEHPDECTSPTHNRRLHQPRSIARARGHGGMATCKRCQSMSVIVSVHHPSIRV